MELLHKIRQNVKIKKFLLLFIEIFTFIYLFFIPSFSARYPFNFIGYFLFGILAAVTVLYTYLFDLFLVRVELVFLPLFAISSFISTLFGSHEFRRWLTIFMMACTFLIMLFIFRLLNNKSKIIKLFVFAMLAFSIYFIVIYYPQLIQINNFSNMRLGEYFDNVNQVGFYFCFAALSAFYLGLFAVRKRDNLYYFAFVLFSILGFTTGSRSTLISLLLGVVCLLIIKFRNKKLLLFISLFSMLVVIVILFNLPFMETLRERFLSFFTTMNGNVTEGSTITRMLWQQYGFYLGIKNTFFGLGEGGFSIFSGVGTYTHGDFSEIFCNFGLIGFLLFYITFIIAGFNAFRNKTNEALFVVVFLVVYFALGFLGVNYYNKITPFILAMILYLSQPNTFQDIVEVRI